MLTGSFIVLCCGDNGKFSRKILPLKITAALPAFRRDEPARIVAK